MNVCRIVTNLSYPFPSGQELKELYENEEMKHSLRYLETESVRPQMKMTDIR